MTVRDLIRRLEDCNPDALCITYECDCPYGGTHAELTPDEVEEYILPEWEGKANVPVIGIHTLYMKLGLNAVRAKEEGGAA